MSGLDSPVTMSPQAGLRLAVRCLPDSLFKETVSRVVDGAIHMMDQQEQRITNLVHENQSLNAETKKLREDLADCRQSPSLFADAPKAVPTAPQTSADMVVRPGKAIPDGVPCGHHGCLHHASHPCEGCGRVAGRSAAVGVPGRAECPPPTVRDILECISSAYRDGHNPQFGREQFGGWCAYHGWYAGFHAAMGPK